MAVRIRLSRGGSTHAPFYYIIATSSTSPRDGKFLEKLGYYNPRVSNIDNKKNSQKETEQNKRLSYNIERIQDWVNKGAQISESLAKILVKGGFENVSKFLKPVVQGEFFKVTREDKKKIQTERKNKADTEKLSLKKKQDEKMKAAKEAKIIAENSKETA